MREPIAVVGMGLRLPGGCGTPDEFAELLRMGRSGIRPVPEGRWELAALAEHDPETAAVVQRMSAGFLDDIDQFDAPFFGIAPKEAPYVDPQQRLLLETTWEAFENANLDPTQLRHGTGGVYIGASSIDYAMELDALRYDELDGHLATGISLFPLCGRLSYFFGWYGPSMTVDTACASSLTALHLAVSGLRNGECDIALCGAVNLLHHPRIPVIFTHANMLSPVSQCKTFDEAADGYVRAEGCCVLVLKRLSDAVRDGDQLAGVIRGTAVRQDGDSAGLTVPNGIAQAAVMRAALADATLAPDDLQYVEAHGTGTPLGDPIELGAVSDVFSESHSHADPLVVGSVKTNLGHMEPVAGIVGLVKVLLQMRAGTIFPHLNLRQRSSRIPWDRYPVTVPTECQPWAADARRAMVNSLGFGGTIASTVLEEPPGRALRRAARRPAVTGTTATVPASVFTLSAVSRAGLRRQVQRYQQHLAAQPALDVADICYTSNVGRAHFRHRLAAPVRDRDGLADLLDRHSHRLARRAKQQPTFRKVAFLFAGQGAQYVGMGASLYRDFPVFRERVDECDRRFTPLLRRSVRAMLLGDDAGHTEQVEGGDLEDIHATRYTQPALFTLEYALAGLWQSWGIQPHVMLGHSLGEVAAAAVAGVLGLDDAVTLVEARGRLMQSVRTPGGMVAVGAEADVVAPLLSGFPDVVVAAANSPEQCVISGSLESLEQLAPVLKEQGWLVTRLAIPLATHSPLMAEVSDDFRAASADLEFHEPELTMVANLTGAVAADGELTDPEYWVRQLSEPVQFQAGMRSIEQRGPHVFVEIGPAGTLTSVARQCVAASDHHWLTSLNRSDPDGDTIRASVAQAYTTGLPVHWTGFHTGWSGRRVSLPTYSFDRQRYWLPVGNARHGRGRVIRPAGRPVDPARTDSYRVEPEPDGEPPPPLVATDRESLLALTGPAQWEAVKELIRIRVADVLRLPDPDAVDPNAEFVRLGLDSMMAVELKRALEPVFRTSLPLSLGFTYPTVERLTDYLVEQLTEAT